MLEYESQGGTTTQQPGVSSESKCLREVLPLQVCELQFLPPKLWHEASQNQFFGIFGKGAYLVMVDFAFGQ